VLSNLPRLQTVAAAPTVSLEALIVTDAWTIRNRAQSPKRWIICHFDGPSHGFLGTNVTHTATKRHGQGTDTCSFSFSTIEVVEVNKKK
jgi:hypothetical protein